MLQKQTEKEKAPTITKRLKWKGLGDHPVFTVNKVLSQFEGDVFLISFGIVDKPVILSEDPETLRELKEQEFVGILPVARIAFTESMMEQVITVFAENLAKFKASKGHEGMSAT